MIGENVAKENILCSGGTSCVPFHGSITDPKRYIAYYVSLPWNSGGGRVVLTPFYQPCLDV